MTSQPARPARVFLHNTSIPDGPQSVAEYGSLRATSFRFASGVTAVRLENELGALVVLPFKGQQIWSAEFGGAGVERRVLTWRSMVAEPQASTDFLSTFGGFLQHCGVLGVGGPGPQDTHALHGELPSAPYQRAWIEAGSDERGDYLAVGGEFRHAVAFSHNYTMQPQVRLYAASSLFRVSVALTNHKQTPMEFFYLAHVNFRPVDGGRLVYSAQKSPQHVRVRAEVPSHLTPKPGYVEMLQELKRNPSGHETLVAGQQYDPEAVFLIDYEADAEGWAHTMQVHPDGSADYLRHRTDELPRATRWISRTPDQDAIAIAEVGTSEPEGATRERAKGNARTLAPGESWSAGFDVGLLLPDEARTVEDQVERILA